MTALSIGSTNDVPISTITSTPDAVVSIENIKNSYAARRARWTSLSTDIVVTGTLTVSSFADYFALPPGHDLTAGSQLRFRLYTLSTDVTPVYESELVGIGQLIPLGIWRPGVDPFNSPTEFDPETTLIHVLPSVVQYQKWEVVLAHNISGTGDPIFGDKRKADATTGVLSLEAEAFDENIVNATQPSWKFNVEADALASGGQTLRQINPGQWVLPTNNGPRTHHDFQSSVAGAFTIWSRMKSTDVATERMAFGLNNTSWSTVTIPSGEHDGVYRWYNSGTHTLAADTDYQLTTAIYGDGNTIYVDKLVMLPSADAAPTGLGPAVSTFPTIGFTNRFDVRQIMVGTLLQFDKDRTTGSRLSFSTQPDVVELTSRRLMSFRDQVRRKRFVLDLDHLYSSDMVRLIDWEARYKGEPFIVSLNHEDDRDQMRRAGTALVLLSGEGLTYVEHANERYSARLELQEA